MEVDQMTYFILKITIHILSFIISFYALSGVQFEKVVRVETPFKAQLLLLLSSMGLGFLVAQFLMALAF